MGMSIEESKRNLSYAIQWKDRPTDESMRLAVDIMCKYQKIADIIDNRYGKPVFNTLDEIIKVVENGNFDN